MKKHIKNYLQATKKLPHEISCEVCGSYEAVNIHHIDSGRKKRSDEFEDLIALCQNKCHRQAHYQLEPYLTKEDLYKIKNNNELLKIQQQEM